MKPLNTLAVEQHHIDQPGPLIVTLAAWNSKGHGDWFAKSFVLPLKRPCVFIAQRQGNHWWHTDEIFQVAECVRALRQEGQRQVVLYGSSMGGYGACHLMELFEADHAIAVAPQVQIDPANVPGEPRWLDERGAVAQQPCFDERQSLGRPGAHLTVFYDPFHAMDCTHIERLHQANGGHSLLHLVPTPYTSHDAARVLARQGILKAFLTPLLEGGEPDWAALRQCASAYRRDAKSFFNYLRCHLAGLSPTALNENLVLARTFLATTPALDFEALYMAAEVFKQCRLEDEAARLIERSIAEYENHYRRPAPAYLLKKRDHIRKAVA
jgi:hypothetical protein